MSRSVPSTLADYLYATSNNGNVKPAEVQPFFAVEANFEVSGSSTNVRVWSGIGDLSLGGNTYVGVGELITISGVEETQDLKATSINITMSGITPAASEASNILNLALTAKYKNRDLNVYFGDRRSPSNYLIAFAGFMDVMTINDDPENATINISVEHITSILARPTVLRHSKSQHRAISGNSSDSFYDFVTSLQDKEIIWGD